MHLKLNTFNRKNLTKEERKAASIVQSIRLEGPLANDEDLAKDFVNFMEETLKVYYIGDDTTFYLKDEHCNKCGKKLKRKDTYDKTIYLPGGNRMILRFCRYSCPHCKEKVDRKLGSLFEKDKHYSSNVKAEAVRQYTTHLSSYDKIQNEIKRIYDVKVNKRTVRLWLKEAGVLSEENILSDDDFSGYLIYDEEFMRVYEGAVGVRGAKLKRKRIYLLLFRDALTKKSILLLTDSLEEDFLPECWLRVIRHLISLGVGIKTITSDGKREYNNIVKTINKILIAEGLITKEEVIKHAYCIFHFKQNLYDDSKIFEFGNKNVKKELPENILNQIKEFDSVLDAASVEEAEKNLERLNSQKNTFIKPLQHHLNRLNKYKKEYFLQIKIPFIRTTDLCENWFSRTKPEKIKKGYKTEWGLNTVVQNLAMKINYNNWLQSIGLKYDFKESINMLTSVIKLRFVKH